MGDLIGFGLEKAGKQFRRKVLDCPLLDKTENSTLVARLEFSLCAYSMEPK